MARVGEGDPRWIAEERADATNVNNWHWTEKNCLPFTKTTLNYLITPMIIESSDGSIIVDGNIEIEGDCTANNRKGRLIFLYDMVLSYKWKARLSVKFNQEDKEAEFVTGTVKIPNFSDENNVEELSIDISLTSSSNVKGASEMLELYQKQGRVKLREQITEYLRKLKQEYCMSLLKPTKSVPNESDGDREKVVLSHHIPTKGVLLTTTTINNSSNYSTKEDNVGENSQIQVSGFEHDLHFKCSPEDAYSVLSDERQLGGWCDIVSYKYEIGAPFVFISGNITGKVISFEKNKEIIWEWRKSSWPSSIISKVKFTIKTGTNDTVVHFEQSGVPKNEIEFIKSGWKEMFWRRLNAVFGYGADYGSF